MNARKTSPEELADQLREITVALRRRARTEVSAIPYAQLSVMKHLEVDGPATTAELARREAMTPQSMGAIVNALETAGYVTRRDDPNHGRRQLLSTTAAGRRALAANRTHRLRRTANVIAERLTADEQRTVAAALSLLRRAFIPESSAGV